MKQQCNVCKNEWEYTGDKEFKKEYAQYISCPTCRANVKLKEGENE